MALYNEPMLFKKKNSVRSYDADSKTPAIRCSICNGEQVAGFKDNATGAFEEVMLIRGPEDLDVFRNTYGITGDIGKIY